MKRTLNLVQDNIENLTSLWQLVSNPTQSYWSNKDFAYCLISNSDWPNRLWFHQDVNAVSLKAAKNKLLSLPTRMIVPYWDIYSSRSYELLEKNGFDRVFEQIAMVVELTYTYQIREELRIKRVSSQEEAMLWTKLFKDSFGYHINYTILPLNTKELSCFIVYNGDEPVGTALLYHITDEVIGIHCVGIIPAMRRKGFAEQLMKTILNYSLEQEFKHATLQASSMGKDLYLKLGFEEQFIMKNYVLQHLA